MSPCVHSATLTAWIPLAALALLVSHAPPGLALADPSPDEGLPTAFVALVLAGAATGQRAELVVTPAASAASGDSARIDVGSGSVTIRRLATPDEAGARVSGPEKPTPTPATVRPHEGATRANGLLRATRDALLALLDALRALGAFLLYHRIAPAQALAHPARARILERLRAQPGIHLSALAEDLAVHAKTLRHHVRVLARGGHVRILREGRTMRLFPMDVKPTAAPDPSLTRRRALALLRAGAARTRSDLARALDVTPQAMSYHLRHLREQGAIRARWNGRERTYEAT